MIATATPTQTKIRWVRITKERAKERWANGEAITLVPCKCHPASPMGNTIKIYPEGFINRAKCYQHDSPLWAGSVEATAWNLMYTEWAHYHTSHREGAHAHYYVAKDQPKICEV